MSYILFGGLFDPPHVGHLEIARAALDETGADILYWIPARRPPHRESGVLPGIKRFEILNEWLSKVENMEASSIELSEDHSGYSIETVKKFKKEKKNEKSFFLIGSDEGENFTSWKEWEKIMELTTLLVGRRRRQVKLPPGVDARILDNRIIEISSTRLRERLARGERPREIMPEVLRIIEKNRLYR